jgi:hypothetical protein
MPCKGSKDPGAVTSAVTGISRPVGYVGLNLPLRQNYKSCLGILEYAIFEYW